MTHPADASVWETWESVFLKTTALGNMIIEETLAHGQRITRIAFVPRGGLYLVNILSRMLGLSGDQTISLGVSKYDRASRSRRACCSGTPARAGRSFPADPAARN